MSILIYKQRHFNKQDENTPRAAYGYIRYIATRSGTMKNGGMQHGLFGRIDAGDGLAYFNDWKNLARRAYHETGMGHTYFKSVISLHDEDALDTGIFDEESDGPGEMKINKQERAGWERYIEKHVAAIAESNNIRIEDLAWVCAIHAKKSHSHAHLVFWDKSGKSREHTVCVDGMAKKRINSLRRDLIKNSFPHKVRAYMENRQIAYHSMRDMTAEIIDGFNDSRNDPCPGISAHSYGNVKEDLAMLHDYFKNNYGTLPVFNKLSDSEKVVLSESAHKLIEGVPEVKMYVERYVERKLIEDSLFRKNSYSRPSHEDDESGWISDGQREGQLKKIKGHEDRAMEKAVEAIARRIYNSVKSDLSSEAKLGPAAFSLLANIVRLLKDNAKPSNAPKAARGTAELSKAARKDKYLSKLDKGFEH
ncbi:MAG: relaxase MobL [Lachnospiraceae bacterium]|nr:relaxase MobL [Lachnospiraceae bacterium]